MAAGWSTRSVATRRDRLDLAASGFRRLPGFAHPATLVTVSVNPGTIGAGEVVSIPVTLTGSGLEVVRHHKCVATQPTTLEAGLVLLTSTVTDAEECTLTLANRTESPIVQGAIDFDFYVFKATGT